MRGPIHSRHRPPRTEVAQLQAQLAVATAQINAAKTALNDITDTDATLTLADARTKATLAYENLTFPTL